MQGSIRFRGDEVRNVAGPIRELRGALLSMVFDDPMRVQPGARIGDQIAEAIAIDDRTGRASFGERVAGLLARVGIADPEARARPIRMNSPAACASGR